MDEKLRGIILAPHPHTLGAVPRVAKWLAAGLDEQGWTVEVWPWGKRSDTESIVAKVVGRSRDVGDLAARVKGFEPDFVVVMSGLDWKSVTRDNVLVRAISSCTPTIILHPHGGQSNRLLVSGDWVFKRAVRSLLGNVDGVFVLSTEERSAIVRFREGTEVRVVENPYDSSCLGDGPRVVAPGRFRVVFVGRLVREKGVFELVEAAADTDGRGVLETVFVGDGPAKDEAVARVAELGLSHSVRFVGQAEGDALADTYRHADVLALPSYSEGFPTVVTEAMGFGLPVVCTAIRGILDYLEDGVNALFVEVGSSTSLREALLRLRDDPELAGRMGARNLELVRRFAPAKAAAHYREAIESVRRAQH